MSFIKDGEVKVFVPAKKGSKEAAEDSSVRYGVDDLVEDSKEEEEEED